MLEDFDDPPRSSKSRRLVPKKKTDRLQWDRHTEKEVIRRLAKEGLIEGRVLDITPETIHVEPMVLCAAPFPTYRCSLRGTLKRDRGEQKNLIVVGDLVFFSPAERGGEGVIEAIQKRRSFLSRADSTGKREKLIAANIDLVLITASITSPALRLPLIDRTIIAARKGNLDPVILINKIDLLHKPSEHALLDELQRLYPALGIPLLAISATQGTHLEALRTLIANKAVVFVGPSGTGKSSLINAIAHTDLTTGSVSHKTHKGVHTTTRAALIRLPTPSVSQSTISRHGGQNEGQHGGQNGGWCIDTPGIELLGFSTFAREDLKSYFPEFTPFASECHFPDCTHIHEPNCAVQRAFQQGLIHPMRLQSYLALFKDLP